MDSDCPLLTLPDPPLRLVLKKCGYMGVQSLRKTCHDLRNYIDDSPPDLCIKTAKIVLQSKLVTFEFTQDNSETFKLEYHSAPNLCEITRFKEEEKKLFYLPGQHYLDTFLGDLAAFFKISNGQKVELQELKCLKGCCEHDIGMLRRSFDNRKLFKVKALFLEGPNEWEFLNVLWHIDPKCIQKLHLASSSSDMALQTAQLAKLELWKTLKVIIVDPEFHVENASRFFHFSGARIKVEEVSENDIAFLLARFRSSNPPNAFHLLYKDDVKPEFYNLIGKEPIREERFSRMIWYFKNSTNGRIFEIRAKSGYIWFKFVESFRVPQGVIVYE